MPKVIFHGSCWLAGVDMYEEIEYDELPSPEVLEIEAQHTAENYYGVESWYEILEDED